MAFIIVVIIAIVIINKASNYIEKRQSHEKEN